MPLTPTYPGVYVQEAPGVTRAIAGVETATTAFVGAATAGPLNDPQLLTSYADYERYFGGLDASCPMSYAVRDFYGNGGSRAVIVRVVRAGGTSKVDRVQANVSSELEGHAIDAADIIGDRASGTGLFSLERVDLFNLLCIPPLERDTSTHPLTYAAVPAEVYQAALTLCVERRAMLLVDPDPRWGAAADSATENAEQGRLALSLRSSEASNAALYFPALRMADPLRNDLVDTFAPCGAVAGIIARTDTRRGVWKAPAGEDAVLNAVQGMQVDLTDQEIGGLNASGINCLRSLDARGSRVWGARTMAGVGNSADEYRYLPVRRLALFLEESLYRGTQWAVFEPNAKLLWAQLRRNVETFMQALFRQGAFQGSTAQDAYFVRCDEQTNTPGDINRGILTLEVGFAPLKPAEFVVIQIQQKRGGFPA